MYKILTTLALLLVFGSSAFMSISGLAAVFATSAIVIACLGAGLETGKILTVVHLHRQWSKLGRPARGFYIMVVAVLCFLTSIEIMGYLSREYTAVSQSRKVMETGLASLDQEARVLQGQIDVIDQTLAGLPGAHVSRRIWERRRAGYDQKQERLLEIARQQAGLRAGLIQDKTYLAPVFSVARIMGLDPDQAARFLILLLVLVLEPLSIGLAVAVSAVWKPADPGAAKSSPAEKLVEKRPEIEESAETAKPAKALKTISYEEKTAEENAGTAEQVKTAYPANLAETANTELHELRQKHGLNAEQIARITGRNKIETVLQWLNNKKEIPEKALRELRKWTRTKNKVVHI